MQSKPTLNAIKIALLRKNLSFNKWAKKNELNYNHALKVIYRYVEKQQVPQSPTVYNVLVALEKDTGINLIGENNGTTFKN